MNYVASALLYICILEWLLDTIDVMYAGIYGGCVSVHDLLCAVHMLHLSVCDEPIPRTACHQESLLHPH